MNTTHPTAVATDCPAWCAVDHDEIGPAFHASGVLPPAGSPVVSRLWQEYDRGSRSGVVVAGKLLSEAEAHELGMALVGAADLLRHARTSQTRP